MGTLTTSHQMKENVNFELRKVCTNLLRVYYVRISLAGKQSICIVSLLHCQLIMGHTDGLCT